MSGVNIETIPPDAHGATATSGADDIDAGPLARLRAQTEQLRAQDVEEFEHPGYVGLFVTYRRLKFEDNIAILYGPDGGTILERNAQLLVKACERVVYREDGEDLLSFPGYVRKLAEALEVVTDPSGEMGEARQIVLGMFGGHEQPMLDHAREVNDWMQRVRKADPKNLPGG